MNAALVQTRWRLKLPLVGGLTEEEVTRVCSASWPLGVVVYVLAEQGIGQKLDDRSNLRLAFALDAELRNSLAEIVRQ